MRGATEASTRVNVVTGISIHAPLAGRDRLARLRVRPLLVFQSARPLRGATCLVCWSSSNPAYFNPRAPCGARPGACVPLLSVMPISIHAPLAGRDSPAICTPSPRADFNPRAPCGARQLLLSQQVDHPEFQSTRPLRGATGASHGWKHRYPHFNPRAPCGARLAA